MDVTLILIIIGGVILFAALLTLSILLIKKHFDKKYPKEEETKDENRKMGSITPARETEAFKNRALETPKPVLSEEEKKEIKEEKKKQNTTKKIRELSKLGLEESRKYDFKNVDGGTEAVGIIFNSKSKVYMFGPKGYQLNPGDVVIVLDRTGARRTVPVVVPNVFLKYEDLVQPFRDIEEVLYQTEEKAPAKLEKVMESPEEQETVEEVVETVEEVVETPKFSVTFNTLGKADNPETLSDLENLPEELPLVSADGFEFLGWGLTSDAEDSVELGMKLENDLELVALWKELPQVVETPKFSVTFNTLGKADNPEALSDLENLPEELPLVSADGFEFLGWGLTEEAEDSVELGMKLENDLELVALWKELPQEDETEEDDEDEEASESDESNEGEAVGTTSVEYDEVTNQYKVTRVKKTYECKMSLLEDNVKDYYNQVKNKLLSYGLKHKATKSIEKFRLGKDVVAQLKPAGKSLALYLALDPNKFVESKYVGKDVSDKKAYQTTPFLYKARTDRKAKWMLELVDQLIQEKNLELVEEQNVDYTKDYPRLTEEELTERGWLTKTVVVTTEKPKGFVKVEELEPIVERKIETVEPTEQDNKDEE